MIRALIVGGIGSLALVLVLVRTTGSFFLVPRSGFGHTSEPAGRRTLQIAHMAHGLGVQHQVGHLTYSLHAGHRTAIGLSLGFYLGLIWFVSRFVSCRRLRVRRCCRLCRGGLALASTNR